jgi:hypothetical protein
MAISSAVGSLPKKILSLTESLTLDKPEEEISIDKQVLSFIDFYYDIDFLKVKYRGEMPSGKLRDRYP